MEMFALMACGLAGLVFTREFTQRNGHVTRAQRVFTFGWHKI